MLEMTKDLFSSTFTAPLLLYKTIADQGKVKIRIKSHLVPGVINQVYRGN